MNDPVFLPRDYVTVVLHDVNYRGRVVEVILSAGPACFLVEYADDKGDFQTRRFFADELIRGVGRVARGSEV